MIIKGIPQRNKIAIIIVIVGIVIALVSFIVACYTFDNGRGEYYYFLTARVYYVKYRIIYDYNFMDFYISEFFSGCIYGYMLILGIVITIVGILIEVNTEKCEIVVTNEAISGKLPHGKRVSIPLNQIIAINPSSFEGISISSIGNVSKFHCFKNRDEVIKAIAYLLANQQQVTIHTTQPMVSVTTEANGEVEQLKGLKELLDAGILTQEEFDEKKKQILGL